MRWRQAGVVVTADGRVAMMCVDMEESTVRAAAPGLELAVWAEFEGSAMATLAGLLSALGLGRGPCRASSSTYLPRPTTPP